MKPLTVTADVGDSTVPPSVKLWVGTARLAQQLSPWHAVGLNPTHEGFTDAPPPEPLPPAPLPPAPAVPAPPPLPLPPASAPAAPAPAPAIPRPPVPEPPVPPSGASPPFSEPLMPAV